MKITKEWLEEKNACEEGIEWLVKYKQENIDSIIILQELIKQNHLQYAAWLIVRTMSKPQQLSYAIYSAELVLHLFEKKSPDYKRPKQAIAAAKKVLKNNTIENRAAGYYAESAAYAAAYYAYYAEPAANSAAAYAEILTKILNYGINLIKMDIEN